MKKSSKLISYKDIPLNRLVLLASLGDADAIAFLGKPRINVLAFKFTDKNYSLKSWKKTIKHAGKLPVVLIVMLKLHLYKGHQKITQIKDPITKEAYNLICKWCAVDKKEQLRIRKQLQSLKEKHISLYWATYPKPITKCVLSALDIILTNKDFSHHAIDNLCYFSSMNITKKLTSHYLRSRLSNWARTGQIPALDGSSRLPWYFYLPPVIWQHLFFFIILLSFVSFVLLYLFLTDNI